MRSPSGPCVSTYEVKLDFSVGSHTEWDDALLFRLFVVESQEDLVGLDTRVCPLFYDLERKFERIRGVEINSVRKRFLQGKSEIEESKLEGRQK
jgi:hypothetical protein